jgi:hypothetical protein
VDALDSTGRYMEYPVCLQLQSGRVHDGIARAIPHDLCIGGFLVSDGWVVATKVLLVKVGCESVLDLAVGSAPSMALRLGAVFGLASSAG